VVVRYAPWWLNLEVLRPDSGERTLLVNRTGGRENRVPSIPSEVYEELIEEVKPLFLHWVEG
jgi:hypothetical protein